MKLLRKGNRLVLEYCSPHSPSAKHELVATSLTAACKEVAEFLGWGVDEVAAEFGVDLSPPAPPAPPAPPSLLSDSQFRQLLAMLRPAPPDAPTIHASRADDAYRAYERGPHAPAPTAPATLTPAQARGRRYIASRVAALLQLAEDYGVLPVEEDPHAHP